MRNLIKSKKKKGFTLIEMVAVVAIIGILAALLIPKVTGYMKEAKKTGVIDQARKVTQAYETAKMKGKLSTGSNAITTSTDVSSLNNETILSLLDAADATTAKSSLDKLPAGATIQNCLDIVGGAEFTVTDEGILKAIGGTDVSTNTTPPTKPTPPAP